MLQNGGNPGNILSIAFYATDTEYADCWRKLIHLQGRIYRVLCMIFSKKFKNIYLRTID